jgi:glycosyltransferase involved in cell wall biosynthesis
MDIVGPSAPDITVSFAGAFAASTQGNRENLGVVHHEDLPEVYRDHHALVVCARNDGFPQAIMEAMSSGLPCILSRHLFERELQHEVNCLIADATPEGIAAAILRLNSDPALYQSLRLAGLEHARRVFGETENRLLYRLLLLGATD